MPCAVGLRGGCPDDATRLLYAGACDSPEQFELEYFDDTYGPGERNDTGEQAFEDVACMGGHNTCADGCTYTDPYVESPEDPGFYADTEEIDEIDGYKDGVVGWDEYSEEVVSQDQCNPTVPSCWTDVAGEYVSGESMEYDFFCWLSDSEQPEGEPGRSGLRSGNKEEGHAATQPRD